MAKINKIAVQGTTYDVGCDIDAALSDTSENPVQNKVVKAALDTKVTLDSATQTFDIANTTFKIGSTEFKVEVVS